MDTSFFTDNGKYLMLALDHRGSFKKYVNPNNPESASDAEVIQTKEMIISALINKFSGVLLDPVWGLPAFAKATAGEPAEIKEKPYLLCLEESGYTAKDSERITELQYSCAQLKEWGASGAKILLYFNPAAKDACAAQLATAQAALADAKKNALPIFLEIVTYGNEKNDNSRSRWVLQSLEKFLAAGIAPDVFKLEYPGDKDSCAAVSKMLGPIPWILLTRGENFEVFSKQLTDAVVGGAVGFLAGRALWQEIGGYPAIEEKQDYLKTIVSQRFDDISNILF